MGELDQKQLAALDKKIDEAAYGLPFLKTPYTSALLHSLAAVEAAFMDETRRDWQSFWTNTLAFTVHVVSKKCPRTDAELIYSDNVCEQAKEHALQMYQYAQIWDIMSYLFDKTVIKATSALEEVAPNKFAWKHKSLIVAELFAADQLLNHPEGGELRQQEDQLNRYFKEHIGQILQEAQPKLEANAVKFDFPIKFAKQYCPVVDSTLTSLWELGSPAVELRKNTLSSQTLLERSLQVQILTI